jgi:hypothetical protein
MPVGIAEMALFGRKQPHFGRSGESPAKNSKTLCSNGLQLRRGLRLKAEN